MVDSILYFVRTTTETARTWAETRGVPCWIEELPGGWVLLRSATVDGLLAGSSTEPEEALLEWAASASDGFAMTGWSLHGVRDGQLYELDDDLEALPWEVDDDRQVRGLLALRGDHSAELPIIATARDEAISAVIRSGWTLIAHDHASMATTVYELDDPGLALLRVGDELHLWLVAGGDPIAGWEWSVHGGLAAVDRLPPGDIGDEVRDILYSGRIGVEPFKEVGMHPTPALVQVLGSQGRSVEVAPELVRALGLPDAARDHLLGEADLTASDDVLTAEPSEHLAGAVADSLISMGRQVAASRSPRRRMWGAIGGAVFIPIAVLLVTLLVRDLVVGREVSWWAWVRAVVVVLSIPFCIAAIRHWWALRGAGQNDPASVPAEYRVSLSRTALSRWLNQRGPSTAVCLLLALVWLGVGAYMWMDEAPLRERGVAVIARVVSVEHGSPLVEFADQQGRTVQAYLDSFGAPSAGDTVEILYDPLDLEEVALADEYRSGPLGYSLVGALILGLVVLAALSWTRVIDWQRVSDWLY
ncbi:MAG: DUF3592 domain-containing protein [Propionicimonas sp.]|nr:DUF3592 domain-containing protein [Propionicimonas sp.]